MKAMKIQLAIAEDNELLREVLVKMFRTEEDMRVVAEAGNGKELVEQLATTRPHIIIMDIKMPTMDGFETTRKVLKDYPNVKVIVHTSYDFDFNVVSMYRLGVSGFVCKSGDPYELIRAIRTVRTGQIYLTDQIFKVLLNNLREPKLGV